MAKYKRGDKIQIKRGLECDYTNGCTSGMVNKRGQWATIVEVFEHEYDEKNSYRIKFDGEKEKDLYFWFDEWFEDVIKPKYEVGDYVRIRNKTILEAHKDQHPTVREEMYDYADKLARITDVFKNYKGEWEYNIDLDNGLWHWHEDWFEYRLGNYEDNKIENHRFKYVIGYNDIRVFKGYIENFYPTGKCVFMDENGKILVIPYTDIDYILPMESEEE